MNDAQLKAFRTLAGLEDAQPVTLTAREMALRPHSLSRDGETARMPDGSTWHWSNPLKAWVRAGE
jgi:hypothetical protein